jgi:hypothetical protein
MRVKILNPRVTFGKVGQIVEAPEGCNVEALISTGKVELAPVKAKPVEPEPDEAA